MFECEPKPLKLAPLDIPAIFELCIQRALQEPLRAYRLAAIVACGDKLLDVQPAYPNEYRPSPLPDPSIYGYSPWCNIHAEQAAILNSNINLQAPHRLLFVARVTRAGRVALARPCQGCFNLALAAGINRVYYTTGRHGSTLFFESIPISVL